MKISQIILKGVKNFDDFHYSFEDSWTQTVPDSLLLMGPNGSGKTTLISTFAGLWDLLGRFLAELSSPVIEIQLAGGLLKGFENYQLAAIEIKGFFDEPVWIYVAKNEGLIEVFKDKEQFGALFSAEQHQSVFKKFIDDLSERQKKLKEPDVDISARSSRTASIWDTFNKSGRIPSVMMSYRPTDYSKSNTSHQNSKEAGISLTGRENLRESFEANRLGSRSDFPNMVFLPSEMRILPEPEEKFSATPEKVVYNWLAEYRPSTRREGSIENYLFTLKALDEQSYNRIVGEANKFLHDKAIAGFDPITRQLMIETKSGHRHPIYELSSGEKQVLLMLAFITRELRPGGVVLIDEPDLHLHVSLSTAFVSHLKHMVAEQNGQLIIASHAPELWELFPETQKIRLGAAEEVLQ